MDLLFIGAIIAFWAVSFGMAIGCDKLRRTSHHRE
ncbi:potassium ABC transporter ATPase [Caballeronia sp. KNU42]